MMFSVLSKSITKQVNRVRREFQEVIRPVVDRAVENAFERYLQEGATRNNPINSSNPNLYNRFNNFFERHQYITTAGINTFTLILGVLSAKFGFDALQLQQQSNELQEAIIRSNQELAESIREFAEVNRQLAEALNINLIIQKNLLVVITEYFVLWLIYLRLVELYLILEDFLLIEVDILVGVGILMIQSLLLLLLVVLIAKEEKEIIKD